MERINEMNPAFPSVYADGTHAYGMTLLDYFAAKAMQALVNNRHLIGSKDTEIISESYKIASHMLEERKKYIKQ